MLLQGWQRIDELNRALASDPPSDFVSRPALVTVRTVLAVEVFDLPSGRRLAYRRDLAVLWLTADPAAPQGIRVVLPASLPPPGWRSC